MRKLLVLLTLLCLLTGCGVPDGCDAFDNTSKMYDEVPEHLASKLALSIGESEKELFDTFEYTSYDEETGTIIVTGTVQGVELKFAYTYSEDADDFTVILLQ